MLAAIVSATLMAERNHMGTRIKATVESAPEERKIIRIGTYRRISTDETNQPYSLEAQQKSLQAFVASQPDHEIVADFTDQQSGVTTDRPGLQQAVTAALERRVRRTACLPNRQTRQVGQGCLVDRVDARRLWKGLSFRNRAVRLHNVIGEDDDANLGGLC